MRLTTIIQLLKNIINFSCCKDMFMRFSFKNGLIFFLVYGSVLNAIDLPQFYRTPFFQESFNNAYDKYTTGLSIRYGHGSTHKAWDTHNDGRPLLSAHGYMDITNIGCYVDSPNTVIDSLGKDMTGYWGGANYIPPTVLGKYDKTKETIIFPPNYTKSTPNDGLIEYSGHFEIDEWDFTFKQDLFWGFFIQAYIPYRDVKIDKITYNNLGSDTLTGADIWDGTKSKAPTTVNVKDFMQEKSGTLNNVLAAMTFNSNWQDTFKKSGVGDILLSAGWHGSGDPQSPIFKRISAEAQIGVLIPTSGKTDLSKPFAVPLGSADSTAIDGRINLYVQVFDFLGVGANAGGLVFFTQERDLRVKTDKNQDGWILLEPSFGKVDYGAQWDVGAYAQLGFKGVIAKIGASYTRQEDTIITIHDDNLLKNYSQQQLNQYYPANNVWPNVVSVNDIVNSDQKLKDWEYYALHFIGGYTLELKSVCPTIFLEYDYPFYGKHTFKTDMFGGTLSVQIKLNF